MANIIRCPHVIECLDGGQNVQGLVTEDSGYVELCKGCVVMLLDDLVADMSTADLKVVLTRVLEAPYQETGDA